MQGNKCGDQLATDLPESEAMFPKKENFQKAQNVLEHRLQLHCSDGGMDGDGVVKDDHKDDYDGDGGDEHEPPPDDPDDPDGPETNQRDRMAKVLHETAVSARVDDGQGGSGTRAETRGDKIGDQVATDLPESELPSGVADQARPQGRSVLGMPAMASVQGNQKPCSGPSRTRAVGGSRLMAEVVEAAEEKLAAVVEKTEVKRQKGPPARESEGVTGSSPVKRVIEKDQTESMNTDDVKKDNDNDNDDDDKGNSQTLGTFGTQTTTSQQRLSVNEFR